MKHPANRPAANAGFLEEFKSKVLRMGLPLAGSLELTSRCNLICRHCYLDPHQRKSRMHKDEMDTERILSVLDEITEAGCLHFLITGGEPLLREDFPVIYHRAKTCGLLTTIFTNGTLITDSILDLFEDLPPYTVEISLYGATEETYERITSVRGSFRKCISGIEHLLARNINVRLKTVLMSLNSHEFEQMEGLAKGYGVKFRFDAAIFPRFNGDRTPLDFRVDPREAVEKELSDDGRTQDWRRYLDRSQKQTAATDKLYQCGAGITGFHIDSSGGLSPCLMMSNISSDLSALSFKDAWQTISCLIRERKTGPDFACAACAKKLLCGYCPAFFELENGNEQIHSAYMCAIGENRYKLLIQEED